MPFSIQKYWYFFQKRFFLRLRQGEKHLFLPLEIFTQHQLLVATKLIHLHFFLFIFFTICIWLYIANSWNFLENKNHVYKIIFFYFRISLAFVSPFTTECIYCLFVAVRIFLRMFFKCKTRNWFSLLSFSFLYPPPQRMGGILISS